MRTATAFRGESTADKNTYVSKTPACRGASTETRYFTALLATAVLSFAKDALSTLTSGDPNYAIRSSGIGPSAPGYSKTSRGVAKPSDSRQKQRSVVLAARARHALAETANTKGT